MRQRDKSGLPGFLGPKIRVIVTLIALALTIHTGVHDTLDSLFELAPTVGITAEEIREVILSVGLYGGWPRALEAGRRFDSFMQRAEAT